VDTCVSDPQANGMQCSGKGDDDAYFRPYAESDLFVCSSPNDLRALIEYMRRQLGRGKLRLDYLVGMEK